MKRLFLLLTCSSPLLACAGSDEPTRRRDTGNVGVGSGDGDLTRGDDTADDPGAQPGDGDAPELDCSTGTCVSECGDGLVFDEACDDGNTRDGDGCSRGCQVEEGFTCVTGGDCDELDGPCTLRVPVTYRDFKGGALGLRGGLRLTLAGCGGRLTER